MLKEEFQRVEVRNRMRREEMRPIDMISEVNAEIEGKEVWEGNIRITDRVLEECMTEAMRRFRRLTSIHGFIVMSAMNQGML